MTGQLPLLAREGMQLAIDHADPRWIEMAKACVVSVARFKKELTVDDIWASLESTNQQRMRSGLPLFATHNASAMGPIMTACAGIGWIRGTGRWERSKVAVKRGNLHQVWESLLYIGGGK